MSKGRTLCMNPDIPSPKLCKRLKAAGYPQENSTWYWSPDSETGEMEVCMLADPEDGEFAAPTIGEMLDYIRQGGYAFAYRVAEALDLFPLGWGGLSPTGAGAQALLSMTAAALAAALAEAKEKQAAEKESDR